MTIIAQGGGWIACGSCGCVHRVKGWRLPSCLVPYVDVPYEDVPTAELEAYRSWMSGPDRWKGHYFEIAEITEVLLARAEGEDHAV